MVRGVITVDGGEKRELRRLDAEPRLAQDPGRVRLEPVGAAFEAAPKEQRSQVVQDVCSYVRLQEPRS